MKLKLVLLSLIMLTYQNCAPVQDLDLAEQSSLSEVNQVSDTTLTDPQESDDSNSSPIELVIETPPVDEPVVVEQPQPVEMPNPSPTETTKPEENSSCNVHVSNSGKDTNSGSLDSPFKNVYSAIKKINNSGVVCFLKGSYEQIKLKNINAPESNPLTLTVHPQAKGEVFIVGGDVSRGIGISVYSSKNIFVNGFNIKNLQKGISFYSVTGGGIHNNKIERVGLEGIHVGALLNYNTRKFEDGPSSKIKVVNNIVDGTGYHIINGKRHDFGEGIYIGTGAKPGDQTHHILVKGNSVKDTSAEAIEVKPHTAYIDVIENTIENIDLQYSGAITIGITNTSAQNAHCRVIGNIIKNVTTRKYTIAGIAVGNGTTEISGNTVSGIDGGRAIRVLKAFHNPNARNVTIKNNTIYGGRIAIHDGDSGYPGMTGIVSTSGNIINP